MAVVLHSVPRRIPIATGLSRVRRLPALPIVVIAPTHANMELNTVEPRLDTPNAMLVLPIVPTVTHSTTMAVRLSSPPTPIVGFATTTAASRLPLLRMLTYFPRVRDV